MKNQFIWFFFIFFWLINAQAYAQSHQLLVGKVIDFKTKEPLPFASIILKTNNLGVFSNADGDFKISDNPSFRNDSLIVTFIGYRRYSFPFKNLRENTTNTIYLKPIDVKLMEVDVVASAKKMNSRAIIRKAIKNIPKNYLAQPNNYISYYRDYQKKDKIYYNLNEAIVQTQDKGINTSSLENRFWLLAFKENTDFRRMELSPYYDFLISENENANKFIKYGSLPDQGGNELFILMNHDPIRRFRSKTFSFVNTFSKDFLSNHVFSNPTPVYNNDLMLYKISFTAKNYLTSDSLLIKGDIYIQPLTYSIHKLNYSGFYVLKENTQKKMFDINIEYGPAKSEDSKMELKYISFNNIFNVVDAADTTYFRLINYELDPVETTNSKVVIKFNHTPDSISASNKNSYEIAFKDKKVRIKSVKVTGKKVILNLFSEETHTLAPNLTVQIGKIKDINGKILGRRRNLEFYQFRELFVQETDKAIEFEKSCYMMNLPLGQNCISQAASMQKYWMNTPVNVDTLSDQNAAPIVGFDTTFTNSQPKIDNQLLTGKTTSVFNADTLIERQLSNFRSLTGSDQVFVHLDRNKYLPGDTVYFQAYIRNRYTGAFESKSPALYTLLFNAGSALADSARYRIADAKTTGWMVVPQNAQPGKYHFAAFTGAMQNYDPSNAFQIDIYVKERSNPKKIEITFNKERYSIGDTLVATIKIADEKGNGLSNHKFISSLMIDEDSFIESNSETNRWGMCRIKFVLPDSIQSQPKFKIQTISTEEKASQIKEICIPWDDSNFELRFLPEGGTFVEGIRQKIGFNATNYKGQSENIVGLLKDGSGIVLDTIRSGSYGPGSFICEAQPGLYVELMDYEGTQKIWPLPTPERQGVTLGVSPHENRSFVIEIQSDQYTGQEVIVSCIMNANQILSKTLTLDKQKRLVIGTEELPSGVIQVTLFNSQLKPLAHRLVFVNADKQLKFDVKVDSIVRTGQEAEVTVSVSDGQGNAVEGTFSIAVTDSLRGINPELITPSIVQTLDYHPYLLTNLPAKVRIKGIENLGNDDRDLLFMVYGWSRFNWNNTIENSVKSQLTNYDLMNMKVLYSAKRKRAGRKLDLVSLEGPSIQHLTANQVGEISIPLDSLPEITRSVTLMPVIEDKTSARGAMLSIPYNEQYFKSNRLNAIQPVIPIDEYKVYPSYQQAALDETTIELDEITVIERKREKKVYHDEYEKFYQSGNTKSLDYEQLWSSLNLETAIRKLINPYQITDNFIVLSSPRSFSNFASNSSPALFVLNGNPIYSDGWNTVKTILPSEMTSLTILKGKQGVIRYGREAIGGIIFINTRSSDPNLEKIRSKWISQNSKDKMLQPINIYRPFVEFYRPTKQQDFIDPFIQNRSTVYWNPEVYFASKEPVKIKFTNLKHRGPVLVTINGVSFTGLIGTGKVSFAVQ